MPTPRIDSILNDKSVRIIICSYSMFYLIIMITLLHTHLFRKYKRFYSLVLKISLTLVTLNPGSGPPPITYILSLTDTADNP